jgi:hypothetical protein
VQDGKVADSDVEVENILYLNLKTFIIFLSIFRLAVSISACSSGMAAARTTISASRMANRA